MNIAADRPNLPVAISRDAQWSLLMVALMPAAVVVGSVLRGILFGDPDVPGSPRRWEAAMLTLPLWAVVEIPSVLGIVWGRRAVRSGGRLARTGGLSNGVIFAYFAVTTVDNHWAPFAWVADSVLLNGRPLRVLVFGVVQLAVGVMLVLGLRTRTAAILGSATSPGSG